MSPQFECYILESRQQELNKSAAYAPSMPDSQEHLAGQVGDSQYVDSPAERDIDPLLPRPPPRQHPFDWKFEWLPEEWAASRQTAPGRTKQISTDLFVLPNAGDDEHVQVRFPDGLSLIHI